MKKMMTKLAASLAVATALTFTAHGGTATWTFDNTWQTWVEDRMLAQTEDNLYTYYGDPVSLTVFFLPYTLYYAAEALPGMQGRAPEFAALCSWESETSFDVSGGFLPSYGGTITGIDGNPGDKVDVCMVLMMLFESLPGSGSLSENFGLVILLPGTRDAPFSLEIDGVVTLSPTVTSNVPRYFDYNPIPEPATGLLALAGIALLIRRKRR